MDRNVIQLKLFLSISTIRTLALIAETLKQGVTAPSVQHNVQHTNNQPFSFNWLVQFCRSLSNHDYHTNYNGELIGQRWNHLYSVKWSVMYDVRRTKNTFKFYETNIFKKLTRSRRTNRQIPFATMIIELIVFVDSVRLLYENLLSRFSYCCGVLFWQDVH